MTAREMFKLPWRRQCISSKEGMDPPPKPEDLSVCLFLRTISPLFLHLQKMEMMIRLMFMIGVAQATTCYESKTTTNPYEFLAREIVETQRGCEVLCDGNSMCVGFAFKDNGFNSSCVMLKDRADPNQICAAETTKFLKKTTGCVARTNITAEFGNDPCIDDMTPAIISNNSEYTNPCTLEQREKQYIVRIVTVDGRRKSTGTANNNKIVLSGDMWAIVNTHYPEYSEKIVAAVCASAGSTKCGCAPLQPMGPSEGFQEYEVIPGIVNPCVLEDFYVEKRSEPEFPFSGTGSSVTKGIYCKAGKYYRLSENADKMMAISAASCFKKV